MTEPMQPGVGEPEIVQWGSAPERPSRLRWLVDPAGRGWRDQRVAWALAALGALALFGSMLDTWQVATIPADTFGSDEQEITAQLAALGSWGAAWMVFVTALVAGTGLAAFGSPALRPAARSIGLAIAGAQVGLLVVMTVSIGQSSALDNLFGFQFQQVELEYQFGRGIYLAYLGLALVGVALWWVQPQPGTAVAPGAAIAPVTATAEPAGTPGAVSGEPVLVPPQPGPVPGPDGQPDDPGGPVDLRVGPAEPFTQPSLPPDDDPRWRRPGADGG